MELGPVSLVMWSLWFVGGLALGAGLAWLVLRAGAEARVAAAEARAGALEQVGAHQQILNDDLDGRQKAIEELVRPLAEQLEGYRQRTAELESLRLQDLGLVKDHLSALTGQTQRIASALQSTHTRGRWGEITLRRSAELAGLSAHCDFSEQLGGEGGRMRPDMRVHLPAGREIVIDAKVPLDGYLKAIEAGGEDERGAHLDDHATKLKRHVDTLASREYQTRLSEALEFVVLFLPHDALLSSACERQRDLVEYALGRGVVFATPTTLFALLKTVAHGWREEQLARNADEIVALAEEMQDRLVTFAGHFSRLRDSIDKTVDHYNKSLGSLETRVLPQSRKIRELGASAKKEMPEIAPVESVPRDPQIPEHAN